MEAGPRPVRRAGFVLAGGQSSRMGRDKALLPYGGVTLVEHVASQIAAAAGSAMIVGGRERYGGLGYPVVDDFTPGSGPLGGVTTALRISEAPWNLIVACDMPDVTADFLRALLEEAERCGGDCLIPVSESGRLEPLCAAYHRASLSRLCHALDNNVLALRDAVAGACAVLWHTPHAAFFRNLNTPEDLERHRAASHGAAAPHRT
jgi:molybdopterin-guanine dinucleotide biosynthesis protein A